MIIIQDNTTREDLTCYFGVMFVVQGIVMLVKTTKLDIPRVSMEQGCDFGLRLARNSDRESWRFCQGTL